MCEAGSESISRAKERATRPGSRGTAAVAPSVFGAYVHFLVLEEAETQKQSTKGQSAGFIVTRTSVHL